MGKRRHRPEHALFVRQCKRICCVVVVEFCGSCEPGRLYCRGGCSELARAESVSLAHDKDHDRGSAEGLEVHRLEERERRDRQVAARKKKDEEPEDPAPAPLEPEGETSRVGDHRCHEEDGPVQVPAPVVASTAAEVADVPAGPLPHPIRAACNALLEWVLVAEPKLLEQAQRRQGDEASCPICGRRGRIVRVISLTEWRHRIRRGLG